MNCSLEVSSVDMEVWFINLWNHFIIPYLMGTIMAGIEVRNKGPVILCCLNRSIFRLTLPILIYYGSMLESGWWRRIHGNSLQA